MARIPEEVIERLKTEVSLEQLAALRGVELKRHGADLIGRCPFHEDKTPSLVISPKKNLWHCLGACNAGGTAIDWVMRAERGVQDFTEEKKNVAVFDVGPHVSSALRRIAERHGSFVAKAEITSPYLALSQPLVLKEDEGRFIWCGLIAEPPLAAGSEEAARKELENWASKFPGSKVEW